MTMVLPSSVASPQDLAAVLRDVRTYASWASRELIKQKVAASSVGAQPVISADAQAIIRAWTNDKPATTADLEALVKALEDYKKAAPVLTITLAAVPTGDVKTKLVAWCRHEIAEGILISFKLNRQILGGMVVAYGSHIHDWSFRRKLSESTTQFHEVLSRV